MLLNRKLVLLIACICLFLSFTTVQDTYAKYTSSVNETTEIAVARWRILVNNYDIRSSSTTSNLIQPTFAGTTNIASGVIAPTATGYFDIVIDATGTDLSFDYTINVANSDDSLVDDVRLTSCVTAGSPLNVNNGSFTGTVSLADQRVKTITCYIEWFDGAGETMDNEADTSTTLAEESVAKINVSANFVQIGNNA